MTLTGDNGILSNTARAKKENERAEILEQMRLDIYGEMTANMGKTPTDEDIERIADNYGDISGNTFEDKILTTEKGNYKIKISDIWTPGSSTQDTNNPPYEDLQKVADNLGKVISETENTDLEDSLGNKITVPAGFYIVTPSQDSTVTYNYTGDNIPTVQDGIVIQNAKDGNQFVWVPVGNIKIKMEIQRQ